MSKPAKKRSKSTERYKKLHELGQGTYGIVYLAEDLEAGHSRVAVKQIKTAKFEDGVHWTALREIKLLREIQNVNIVGLLDVFANDVIKDDQAFKEGTVQAYLQMTLLGIKACHDAWILHRDLKPSNLLIDSNGVLKLADFGLARVFGSPGLEMTSQVVTIWYRAPELLFGAKQYGTGVDIWSIALIFAELITRIPLLKSNGSEIDQLSKIFHLLGTPNEEDWPGMSSLPSYLEFAKSEPVKLEKVLPGVDADAIDLLQSMLRFDPSKRLTAEQALKHPYFTGPNAVPPTPPNELPKFKKAPKTYSDDD